MSKIINNIIAFFLPYVPKAIIRAFANKYIAGTSINESINVIKKINKLKFKATLDILGEHTTNISESRKITNEYIQLIKEISKNNLDCNISLKLSHVGLDINNKIMNENIDSIFDVAIKNNNFIRLDMENHKTTDNNIKAFSRMKRRDNRVGIVFQAYLHRTYEDIGNLDDNSNIRLCKGIYIEPKNISIKDHNEINKNFIKVLKLAFEKNIFVGIATHDEILVEQCLELIKSLDISSNLFEFQALYGVPITNILNKINTQKYNMRIYVPFGKDWYKYSMRRLKENPNISWYIINNLFRGNVYK